MEAKDVIDELREAAQEVKNKNQEVISADALLKYLDALEKDAGVSQETRKQKLETDLALFRADHERNLAHYNATQQSSLEVFRSVITYGQAALKSAMLINGGAVVALLAFIGNVLGKGVLPTAIDSLAKAAGSFVYGVLAAAIGTGTSYLTQHSYNEDWDHLGIFFQSLTIVIVLLSYYFFWHGASEAAQAIKQLAPIKPK